MKNIKIIVYLAVMTLVVFSACKKEDNFTKYNLGTEFLISSSLTSLDDQVTVNVDNISKNLSTIAVSIEGSSEKLTDIAISDGVGSATFAASDLGLLDIDSTIVLQFDADFDGKHIVRYNTITVEDPISVTVPEISHRDTLYSVNFNVSPVSATGAVTTASLKVFSTGTYASATIIKGDEKDSILINGLNYNTGDTLYVKINSVAGSKSATTEEKIVVKPHGFKNVDDFILDNTADQAFDLVSAQFVELSTSGDAADINIIASNVPGYVQVGFESTNNAEFIVSTDSVYSAVDSIDVTKEDFSGAINSFSDTKVGEVYIYRTRRGTGAWSYGILKITNIDSPAAKPEQATISFEYKH